MRRWGRPFHGVIVVMIAAGPLFVMLYWWQESLLGWLTAEDGPTEYLSSVFYFAAAALFVLAGLRHAGPWLWMVPLVALSILVGGEEISWGQRLLGFGTPGPLTTSNVQGEANLHNIDGIHGNVRAAVVLFFLTGFVLLPLAVRLWGGLATLVSRLRFPLPPLVVAPVVLLGIAFMVAPRLAGLEGGSLFVVDEVGEFYLSVGWVLFAWAVWRPGVTDRGPERRRVENLTAAG